MRNRTDAYHDGYDAGLAWPLGRTAAWLALIEGMAAEAVMGDAAFAADVRPSPRELALIQAWLDGHANGRTDMRHAATDYNRVNR